jgi:hypothetical protein
VFFESTAIIQFTGEWLFTCRFRHPVVRCSIAAASSKRLTLISYASPTRSLKQETDATSDVYLWCRGRLQNGSLDRDVNKALAGLC